MLEDLENAIKNENIQKKSMTKVAVDPKLFIRCRLCLEDVGQYQITPNIQEQIKYCFEIVVEPFDGLPQLLCQKCESILCEYFTIKQKFISIQDSLRQKTAFQKPINEIEDQHLENVIKVLPEVIDQEVEPSENEETESKKAKKKILSLTRKELIISNEVSDHSVSKEWESEYVKTYYCRLCSYKVRSLKYLQYHRTMHKTLKINYSGIFQQYCFVKLDKLDNKPNITYIKDSVMLSKKNVIISCNDYFIRYTPKHKREDYDSISSEGTFISKRKKRIISNSSGDTVVIDKDVEINDSLCQSNITNDDYIQISSDESDPPAMKKVKKSKTEKTSKLSDNKSIENVISNCRLKFMKRIDETKNTKLPILSYNNESQLNHKVLSIGRKVLNGNHFNCTGLLRFLECKNLPVLWTNTVYTVNNTRDSNVVIRTTFNDSSLESLFDDVNWNYLTPTNTCIEVSPIVANAENLNVSVKAFSTSLRDLVSNSIPLSMNIPTIAVCKADTKAKLLNASPVPNPKQLPSKNINESSSVKISTHVSKSNISGKDSETMDNENNNSSFTMPIITSTKSLVSEINKKVSSNLDTIKDSSYPRIKVKPVSELMSAKALNNLAKEQASLMYDSILIGDSSISMPFSKTFKINQDQGVIVYNQVAADSRAPNEMQNFSLFAENGVQITPISSNDTVENSENKYVILDTVDLPNKKTNSPFQYVADLLQLHNLTLLGNDENIKLKYISLIKFKVSYKQDLIDKPILLGIQLYYRDKTFCIKIRDKDQGEIFITTLLAHWQWEILKTFRGDVVNKLLANAKEAGADIYNDTVSFIYYLKSIKFTKL